MMENLSKLTRLQNDRHLGRYSTDSVESCLVLADTIGRNRPILDHLGRDVGRVSAEMSVECRPRCRSSVGRDVGRVAAEMSVECRPRYRPSVIRLTDQLLTDSGD